MKMFKNGFTLYHGIALLLILSLLDRFIFEIPDFIFVPYVLCGLGYLVYLYRKDKREG